MTSPGAFARSDWCGGSLKDSAAKAETETREGEAEEAGGCRPETLLGGVEFSNISPANQTLLVWEE